MPKLYVALSPVVSPKMIHKCPIASSLGGGLIYDYANIECPSFGPKFLQFQHPECQKHGHLTWNENAEPSHFLLLCDDRKVATKQNESIVRLSSKMNGRF